MSKILFGSFAAIVVSVVGVLDYTMQSRRADLSFGQLGLGDYIASMGSRFTDMKSEQAAAAEVATLRLQEMRTFLPEAPEGWTMREWNEGDRARLWPPVDDAARRAALDPEFAAAEEEILNNPMIATLNANADRQRLAAEQAEIRFYQRGDSLIALRLDFTKAVTGGFSLNGAIAGSDMQNAGMNIIAGNITAMSGREGFAVIGGVAFGEELGLFGFDEGGDEDDATTARTFRGKMGGEITITARAMASDADLTDLLGQIDYDTLNRLLTTPLEGVGSAAPQIAAEESQAIAEAAVEAQADAVIARGRQSEADIMALGEDIQAATDVVKGDAPETGGLLGMFFNRTAEAQAEAEAEAAAAVEAAPAEGSLAALMAPPEVAPEAAPEAEATAAAETATPAETAPAPEVRIRRAGSVGGENCEMTG
ncbi:MAG: hypothetical protein ACRC6I_02270, partial [Paracoccaceae bacterium]